MGEFAPSSRVKPGRWIVAGGVFVNLDHVQSIRRVGGDHFVFKMPDIPPFGIRCSDPNGFAARLAEILDPVEIELAPRPERPASES